MTSKNKSESLRFNLSLFNEPWLDNGLENFWGILESIQKMDKSILSIQWQEEGLQVEIYDWGKFADFLTQTIKQRRDTYIFYWDKDPKTGITTNKKKFFVLPKYGRKIGNLNSLRESIYRDDAVFENLKVLKDELLSDKKKKSCPTCGKQIARTMGEVKQSNYPSVTKIKSLSGVRTSFKGDGSFQGMKQYYRNLCPFCYLIGTLEWADPGIIYRSLLNRVSIVLLPIAVEQSFADFHKMKHNYAQWLSPQERLSNVRVQLRSFRRNDDGVLEEAASEGFALGKYTLLLGFYERVLREIASKIERLDFDTVVRKVSRNWLAMDIPEGETGVKNIRTHKLTVENQTIQILTKMIEADLNPYGDVIGPMWLADNEGKPVRDQKIESPRKEALAEAIIENNYDSFATGFLPHRRVHFVVTGLLEDKLTQFIKQWRCPMPLTEEKVDLVKKAGRAVAKIAGKNISLYYTVEKARNLTELLDALREVGHKLVGMKREDLQYISLDSIERLVETLHATGSDRTTFNDIRNTLTIFAAVEYAKQNFRGGTSNE